MKTAGHTIIISGPTLIFCFLGLIILPLDFVQSTGIGSAVSIFITLLCNLTLAPSLLLTFPNFFSACVLPLSLCGDRVVIRFGARPDTGGGLCGRVAGQCGGAAPACARHDTRRLVPLGPPPLNGQIPPQSHPLPRHHSLHNSL